MTELKEFINDFKKIIHKQGYSSCRFMYCERDEIAAEEEFEDLIPLAKKYNVDYEDLLNQDDEYPMDMWECGDSLGWRIQKKIEENITEIDKELGDVL